MKHLDHLDPSWLFNIFLSRMFVSFVSYVWWYKPDLAYETPWNPVESREKTSTSEEFGAFPVPGRPKSLGKALGE